MTQTYKVQVSMNQAHIVESGFVWKQGDFGFNIEIEVLDFDTTGATPQIIFRKSTGAVEATQISVAGNKFTYAIRGTELDTPGPCVCDLKLKDSTTKRVSTASFKYFVIPDTMDGLNQEASSYSDTIANIVAGFDDAIEENKNAAINNAGISRLTSDLYHGNIETTHGTTTSSTARLCTDLIDVSEYDVISANIQDGYRIALLYYDASGNYTGDAGHFGSYTSSTNYVYVRSVDKIRAVIIKQDAEEGYVMPFEVARDNYLFVRNIDENWYATIANCYFERGSAGIYFTYKNQIYIRGSISLELPTVTNLGLELVTSPLGIANCIFMDHNKALVWETTKYPSAAIKIVSITDFKRTSNQIPLLIVSTSYNTDTVINGLLFNSIENMIDEYERVNEASVLTTRYEPYLCMTASSGIYFNSNGQIFLRGYSLDLMDKTWSNMTSISFLGDVTLTESPEGVTNCLYIPHNKVCVYIPYVQKLAIIDSTDLWKYPCAVLIFQAIAHCNEETIINGAGRIVREISHNNGTDVSKLTDFSKAFLQASKNTEACMFFSDPHVMGKNNTYDEKTFTNFVNSIQYGYENTPTSFIVDGGDWLNSGDYQATACTKLGRIDGAMRKRFKNYYPVNGNHDTNYQGTVSAIDSSRGDLPFNAMEDLHYRENEHQMYYSFKGTITQNYVFDSGLDWDSSSMYEYRWAQIDWFANKLLSDDEPYALVWVHIAFTDWQEHDPTQFHALITYAGEIIEAYNERTSVTLNSITYDFSNCTGKVWCVLCGHTHYDMEGTVGGVAALSIINATNSDRVSYDLCLFDFDNSVLKTFRVGAGNDRVINL